MKSLIVAVTAVMMLSGCAEIAAKRAQMQQELNRTTPYCENEKQCAERWSAAQVWVTRNCGMKIQVATDSIIETYNSPQSSLALAARVVKEPMGNGKYRFVVTTGCGNMFGCRPDPFEAALDFNRYVGSI